MHIKQLDIKNFRNIDSLELSMNSNLNIFVGDNGQGKTNILESIFLLTTAQSFRPGNNLQLINNLAKEPAALLKANILKNNLSYKTQFLLQPRSKKITINSKSARSTHLINNFHSIIFSPESLSAIKEGPEQRRMLVDELLISLDASNLLVISEFRKILKHRNKLLKDFKLDKISEDQFMGVLESLDQRYLLLAATLTDLRIKALKSIAPQFKKSLEFVLNKENVDISVDYIISDKNAIDWSPQEIKEALFKRQIELRKAEISSGISLVGPHKHDIPFRFDGEDSRYYCSQGQQRAIILSFKIAQVEIYFQKHNEYPFLLLDDVMSELDKKKREQLILFLNKSKSQIILTTTEVEPSLASIAHNTTVFNVDKGRVIVEK